MNPDVVKNFEDLLQNYMKEYKSPQWNIPDPFGFPQLNGGVWAPWIN